MTGAEVIDRRDFLRHLRSPQESMWREISYLGKAKEYGKDGKSPWVPHSEIYDTTLRRAGRMQANGITSMLFPREQPWLDVRPPWELRKETGMVKDFREASEAMLHYLEQSNFYSENHGVITARSFDGTGAMAMEWLGDEGANFRRHFTGSYYIDQDTRGVVNTFCVEYNWSAHQAREEWGEMGADFPANLIEESNDPKKRNNRHNFVLLVERRPPWEIKDGGSNKELPFRFIVVEEKKKTVILDSGLETFPYIASRYEQADQYPWGYSPAWEVLPDAYKANYAAQFMMVMGERAAVPPIVAPASMKDEGVGNGAGEITYVSDLNQNAKPYELGSNSNFSVGMDIWKMLQDSIESAYHGHLFQMFNRADREMTATEASMRQGELNAQVSPTITALNKDHTKPTLTWLFKTLVKQGKIEIPEEALNLTPQFGFRNAITMNHRRQKAMQGLELVGRLLEMESVGAQVDVLHLAKVKRKIWRDSGLDEDDLLSEQQFLDNEQAKAEVAQQEAQMEQAKQGSEAMKNVGQSGMGEQLMEGMRAS